ncbi:G-protein coupled receptor 83-like, partial [Oppia nitens]|uniref:G-protein coupled receptor 83-like n=1 Tax=Oppia nitens TaxID=1686743 RepID=UPI0023D9BA1F
MLSPANHTQYQQKRLIKNIAVIGFYSLIIFVSLFGNLLVCYVILSKRRLRSRTTNILILNLTISDLLLTLFNIPLTTARLLLDNWPFGTLLCKLGPFIQAMSVYVSTISMTIIAIDRYQVLVGLLRKRYTTTVPTSLNILMIWLLAGILSLPHAWFNQVKDIFIFKTLLRCQVVYPPEWDSRLRKWITLLTFSTQYSIPLIIITICYARIGVHIWKRVGIGALTLQQRCDQNQSKRTTIKMLITVVVVFAICWLPLNIHHIRSDFGFGDYSSNIFL